MKKRTQTVLCVCFTFDVCVQKMMSDAQMKAIDYFSCFQRVQTLQLVEGHDIWRS